MNKSNFPDFSSISKSEILYFDKVAIFLRMDDILQIHMLDDFDCKLAEAQRNLDAIIKLSNGKKYPILAIYGNYNNFSNEAKELVANHTLTLADALVTQENWAIQLLAKIYLRVNKPLRPTKVFDDVEEAVDWLKTFL